MALCKMTHNNTDEMSVDKMSVGSADQISVCKILFDELSVDNMSIGDISIS